MNKGLNLDRFKSIYDESTLIHGYQFLWIREETYVCKFFIVLRCLVYTSMEVLFSLGTKFRGLAYPEK